MSCTKPGVHGKESEGREWLTLYPTEFIASENEYTDSKGTTVIIQNSVPKGLTYNPPGKSVQGRIFWNRVINETDRPLELFIDFPDNLSSLRTSGDYLKIFVPPDTMTIDKESRYSYGFDVLRSKAFLDTVLLKPTALRKAIGPRGTALFYVGVLFSGAAAVRSELVMKEQKLFYKITGIATELDTALIPCGHIAF